MANTAPKMQMHFDVLLSVAEKLLFSPDNDFRLDMRDPNADLVNFMFAGPICRWAFFTQFRRLTKLSVNLTEIHLSCPTPIQGIRGSLANNKEFFQGPCVVSDKFFYVLFCQGVLQPKIIDSYFKFGLKGSSSGSTIASTTDEEAKQCKKDKRRQSPQDLYLGDVLNESSAESLIRLFFFKDSQKLETISSEDLNQCDLKLDHVKIQDDTGIFKHLARILNLNAERVLLEVTSEFGNCVSKFHRPRVSADRTQSVTLSYTIDIVDSEYETQADLPLVKLFHMLRYMAHSCPNLNTFLVHFLLQGEFSDEDFKVLSKWLKRAIEGFADKLSALDFSCELTISFRAFFPESTLMEASKTDHELARMGEQRVLDDADNLLIDLDLPDTYTIARKIQIQEKTSIVYSLIGIEDDSTNNDWDGFRGQLPAANMPPIAPFLAPALGMAANQPQQYDQTSDDLSE